MNEPPPEKVFLQFSSNEEADTYDENEIRSLTGEERLQLALDLMAPYYAAYTRIERVLRIVELEECPVSDHWGLGDKLFR